MLRKLSDWKPNKYMMWNMVQKTPAGFQFVVKTHQSMTHQRTAGKEAYGPNPKKSSSASTTTTRGRPLETLEWSGKCCRVKFRIYDTTKETGQRISFRTQCPGKTFVLSSITGTRY
ncbi:MAG: DUF72 domain-containing protein [Firmicutes bacterium]|nr:DUF72 domain-containing protein [Bacillota bacterium]